MAVCLPLRSPRPVSLSDFAACAVELRRPSPISSYRPRGPRTPFCLLLRTRMARLSNGSPLRVLLFLAWLLPWGVGWSGGQPSGPFLEGPDEGGWVTPPSGRQFRPAHPCSVTHSSLASLVVATPPPPSRQLQGRNLGPLVERSTRARRLQRTEARRRRTEEEQRVVAAADIGELPRSRRELMILARRERRLARGRAYAARRRAALQAPAIEGGEAGGLSYSQGVRGMGAFAPPPGTDLPFLQGPEDEEADLFGERFGEEISPSVSSPLGCCFATPRHPIPHQSSRLRTAKQNAGLPRQRF